MPTLGIWGAMNSACLAAAGLLPHPPLHPVGSKESLFSSTITASEEAMTVLEEVIMYTFQQCVYYISKVCAPRERAAVSHGASTSIPSSSRAAQESFFKLLLFGSCIMPRCFPLGRNAPIFGRSPGKVLNYCGVFPCLQCSGSGEAFGESCLAPASAAIMVRFRA